jgi:putative nucleotidyltransferase with HDIG domain
MQIMEKQTLFQKLLNEENYKTEIKTEGVKYSMNIKIPLILFTLVIITFFFVFQIDNSFLNQERDKEIVWQQSDLNAEFTYPVFKNKEQLEADRIAAENNTRPVFEYNSETDDILEVFLESAKNQIIDYSEDNNSEILDLERELIDILAKMKESERKTLAQKMVKNIESFIRDIHSKGFIDISLDKITTAEIIIISKPNEEYYIKKDFLTDQSTFLDRLENDLYKGLEPLELAIYRNIISNISNPNLIFSKELTNHQKQLNIASVPKTIEIIPEGTTIVKKGELIDEKTQNRINSYFESELIQKENNYPFLYILSNFGYVFILYSILLLYLFVLRKKIFYDNKQMAIISFILILSALLSWLSMEIKIGYSVEYLVFIPALSMLVAVVYDSRTAFYVTVTMSLMLAGIRGNDYDLAITMLFSGTLAAYTVKDIQNRTQMFQSMFYIFIGLMLSIIVFSIENNLNWNVLYQKTAFALINAALSPLLALGLIILLEKASSITTDLKIKEFDNLDHPLLVKLSETAPGTYQHSLGVASLAERCARRVNGNPLLVKVGSYYHDIGKMMKPEYFTENQIDMENKHDKLQPKKSAQIIREHVEDGIEMAKQYKLPQRLIDFISTHHGTSLIKHFYATSLENDPATREEDFRYPGPKPRTLDEAIVMICDSAEAIARVVAKSEEEIIKIHQEHLKQLINDGQFDECNITMQEIQIVKDTIYKTLKGLGHQRVEYKQIPKK